MSSILVDHAILAVTDLKAYAVLSGSSAESTTELERAINAAGDFLERRLDRQLITRGALYEYWSPKCYRDGHLAPSELRLGDWPIAEVISVHESLSAPRVYDTTTLLTAGTDYELVADRGILRRLSQGLPWPWITGHKTVKVTYRAGYRKPNGTADTTVQLLPEDLRHLAMFVATSIFQEAQRKGWGISQQQDSTGNVTRFMGYLPPSMEAIALAHSRYRFGDTWERAAA